MPDTDTTFWFAGSHEEFPPSELLRQAQAADQAGFDGLGCSHPLPPPSPPRPPGPGPDRAAPGFPDGRSGEAWAHLGALGRVTELPIGTGVTPVVHHYHPGVVA